MSPSAHRSQLSFALVKNPLRGTSFYRRTVFNTALLRYLRVFILSAFSTFASVPPSVLQESKFPLLAHDVLAADISYIYDARGRLRGVVDPASDTAVYNYDAAGNLLSITRQASSTVSIIEFIPTNGPVGTTVTIYGTGYSTTATQNTVTFNGVAATVTSSTATQIVTTVPSGATTGAIAVTTPTGSATSSSAFTVTSAAGAPTITGFTPTIGTPGTDVTITGTNFETTATKNKVKFNIGLSLV